MKIFQHSILLMIAARTISCIAFTPSQFSSRKQKSKLSYKSSDGNQGVTAQRIEDTIKLKEGYRTKREDAKQNNNSVLRTMSTASPTVAGSVIKRKKWGIDNQYKNEYWFDSRIHTIGNVGFLGAIHAALAPFFTLLIDIKAYDGIDIRSEVAKELSRHVRTTQARVLDLCCGVGMSTRALQGAFPDADAVIGVDTSAEMVSMARFITSHVDTLQPWYDKVNDDVGLLQGCRSMSRKLYEYVGEAARNSVTSFTEANAESTPFPESSFNLVTVMYGFHEVPWDGRHKILKEACRVLQPGGLLAVIDLCSDYKPAPSMLAGEPYVLEYQKNIARQLSTVKGFASSTYKTIVPGHVGMWVLRRSKFKFM